MTRTTGELREGLLQTADLERFLGDNKESFRVKGFSERFRELFESSGMGKAELAQKAGVSEVYIYQLLAGARTPSRERVLCLCFGLGLGLHQTDEMLRSCGCAELYPRRRRDAVVIYSLEKHLSLMEVNELLCAEGEKALL